MRGDNVKSVFSDSDSTDECAMKLINFGESNSYFGLQRQVFTFGFQHSTTND